MSALLSGMLSGESSAVKYMPSCGRARCEAPVDNCTSAAIVRFPAFRGSVPVGGNNGTGYILIFCPLTGVSLHIGFFRPDFSATKVLIFYCVIMYHQPSFLRNWHFNPVDLEEHSNDKDGK